MSKTLLCIESYQKISDFLPAMWPHYEKAGCDIVGINRSNAPTTWPKDIPTISYGEDVFKRWCEHNSKTLLNDRMLGVMECLLADERFVEYTDFCVSIWTVAFTHALPKHPGGIVLHCTGGKMDQFEAPFFFHYPHWFDRPTGALLVKTGRDLMAQGRLEHGSNDVFFGLMIHTAAIAWTEVPAYSRNTLDEHSVYMREAREAIEKGAWWVHGIKNKAQLEQVFK